MKNSERIYNKFINLWNKNNVHPFVQGMADGTLPRENFKFFMIQDHLYLMQYSKVFAMGVLKASREDDMRLFAHLITDTLNVENAIHKSYLAELGLTGEELAAAEPSIVTDSYTNYMISIAQKDGLPEIMAAVLACAWTYKLIGDYMETYPGAKEQPFYGKWVCQYMGEGYRNATQLMIDMFDRYTENCTEDEMLHIEHIIYACSQYEYMFWDMAWDKKMIEVEL